MDELLGKGKKPTPLPAPKPPSDEEKLMELYKKKHDVEKELNKCRTNISSLQAHMKGIDAQIQVLWRKINGDS